MAYNDGLDPKTQLYIRSLPTRDQNRLSQYLQQQDMQEKPETDPLDSDELAQNVERQKYINSLPERDKERLIEQIYGVPATLPESPFTDLDLTQIKTPLTPQEALTVPNSPGLLSRQEHLDARAFEQSNWDVLKNFTGRLSAQTLAKFGETLGYLGGDIAALMTGDFTKAIDNGMIRAFEQWDDQLRQSMPNYSEFASWYKDKTPLEKVFDPTFWTSSEGTDALAFMLEFVGSAYLTGGALKAAGVGARGAKMWETVMRDLSKVKSGQMVGEFASRGVNLKKLADQINRASIAGMAAFGEAGFESRNVYKDVQNQLIGQLNPMTGQEYSQEEINNRAGEAAFGNFWTNIPLLYFSDKFELDGLFKTMRGTADVLKRSSLISKSAQAARKAVTTGFVEGTQEQLQLAAHDYYTANALGEDNRGWLQGMASNYAKSFSTEEGAANFYPAFVMGMLPGGVAAFRQATANNKHAAALQDLLDKNVINYRTNLKNFLKYTIDDNGNRTLDLDESGKPQWDQSKIQEGAMEFLSSKYYADAQSQLAQLGDTEAWKALNNQQLGNALYSSFIRGADMDFIDSQIDLKATEDAKDTSLIRDYNPDGTPVTAKQLASEYKQLAREYFRIYDNVEGRHAGLFDPQINRKDFPDKKAYANALTVADRFKNELRLKQYTEGVRQFVQGNQLRNVQSRMAAIEGRYPEGEIKGIDASEHTYLKQVEDHLQKSIEQSYKEFNETLNEKAQRDLLKARIETAQATEAEQTNKETTTTTDTTTKTTDEPFDGYIERHGKHGELYRHIRTDNPGTDKESYYGYYYEQGTGEKKYVTLAKSEGYYISGTTTIGGNLEKEDLFFGGLLKTMRWVGDPRLREKFTTLLSTPEWRNSIRVLVSDRYQNREIKLAISGINAGKPIGVASRTDGMDIILEANIDGQWQHVMDVRNPSAYVQFVGTAAQLAKITKTTGDVLYPDPYEFASLFKPVDFSRMTYAEFEHNFVISRERRHPTTIEAFNEIKADYDRLRTWNTAMHSWLGTKKSPEGFTIPAGSLELTLAGKLLGGTPMPITDKAFKEVFNNKGAGYILYDAGNPSDRVQASTDEGTNIGQVELKRGNTPPIRGGFDNYTGIFALATLPNGLKTWVAVAPLRLPEGSMNQMVEDINELSQTIKDWGNDPDIPQDEIDRLIKEINSKYFLTAPGYWVKFVHVQPTADHPHLFSLSMAPKPTLEGAPLEKDAQWLNLSHLKSPIKDVGDFLALLNSDLGVKFGMSFTVNNLRANPSRFFSKENEPQAFRAAEWETTVHPNIVSKDSLEIKVTYNPESIAAQYTPPTTQNEEMVEETEDLPGEPEDSEDVTEISVDDLADLFNEPTPKEKAADLAAINEQLAAKDVELEAAVEKLDQAAIQRLYIEIEQLNAQKIKAQGNTPFRIDEGLDALPFISIERAVAELKDILPASFKVKDIRTILNNLSVSSVPAGVVVDNTVYLHEAVRSGVQFHEAFHVVFRHLLDNVQIRKYINAAKVQRGVVSKAEMDKFRQISADYIGLSYDQLADLMYEEHLADEFMNWKNKRNYQVSGTLNALFTRLWDWIKSIFRYQTDLEKLFMQISDGKFKNAATVVNKFSLARTAAYKVLSGKGVSESENVIYTVAGMMMEAEVNGEQLSVAQILDNFVDNQNLSNSINKTRFDQLQSVAEKSNFIRALAKESAFYKDPNNRVLVANAVNQVLKELSYAPVNPLEEVDPETGSSIYEHDPTVYNLWDTASRDVKKFIGTTLYPVTDELGRQMYLDPTGNPRPLKRAVNASEIFNSLLYSFADKKQEEILPLLKYRGLYEVQMGALWNRLEPYLGSEEFSKQQFVTSFVRAFQANKVVYHHTEIETSTGIPKVNIYVSNRYRIENNIVAKWNSGYQRMLLQNPNPEDRDRVATIFQKTVNNILTDVANGVKSPAFVGDLVAAFKTIGIDISEGYAAKIARLDSANPVPVGKDFRMPAQDFTKEVADRIRKDINIFKKSARGMDMQSYMLSIARSDAEYRSDLFADNFTDATGKRRYTVIAPMFINSRIRELQQLMSDKLGLDQFIRKENGLYSYVPFLTQYNQKTALQLIHDLDPVIVGDVRETELRSSSDGGQFTRNRSGTSFKTIDETSLLADTLNHSLMASTVGGLTTGYFYTPLPSGGRIQFAVRMPFNSNLYNERGLSDEFVNLVYDKVFLQEFNLLKGKLDRPFLNKNFAALPFLDINSMGDVPNEGFVKDRIRTVFGDRIEEFRKLVDSTGALNYVDAEKVRGKGGKDRFLSNFYLNDFINRHGINMLINGPLSSVKDITSIVKRWKGTNSAGKIGSGTIKQIYLEDEKYPINTKTLQPDPQGDHTIEPSDGQVFGSLNFLKRILTNNGDLKSDIRRQLIDKLIDPPINPDTNEPWEPRTNAIYTVNGKDYKINEVEEIDLINLKDVVYGQDEEGLEVYIKSSTAWLMKQQTSVWDKESKTWVPLRGKEYRHHLRETMEKNNVDTAIFLSASKKLNGEIFPLDAVMRGEAVGVDTFVREVPGKYQVFQTPLETNPSKLITYSTQLLHLADSYLPDNGEVNEIRGRYQTAVRQLHDNYFNQISRLLENPDGTPADLSNFYLYLRNATERIGLDTVLNELFQEKYDPNLPHSIEKFEQLLISMFSPALYLKGSGKKLTMQTPTGYLMPRDTQDRVITTEELKKNPRKYEDTPVSHLKIYTDEKGRRVAEVVSTPQVARALGLSLNDVAAVDPDRLTGVGVRIPSEGHHSMLFMKLVDFLPPNYGDTIIGPPLFYFLAGVDNDADPVFLHNKDYYFDYRKSISLNRPFGWKAYGSARSDEDKWYEFKTYMLNRNPFVKEKLEEIRNNYQGAAYASLEDVVKEILDVDYIPVFRSLGLPATPAEYKAAGLPENNGAVYNRLIDITVELITRPELADIVSVPATNKPLGAVIKKIENELLPQQGALVIPEDIVAYMKNWKNIKTGGSNIGVIVNSVALTSYLTKNSVPINENLQFVIDNLAYTGFASTPEQNFAKTVMLMAIETAMTDNEKDPMSYRAGLYFHTSALATTMLGMNVPAEVVFKIMNLQSLRAIGDKLSAANTSQNDKPVSRTGLLKSAQRQFSSELARAKQKLPENDQLSLEELDHVVKLSNQKATLTTEEKTAKAFIEYKIYNILLKVNAVATESTDIGQRLRVSRWNYSNFERVDQVLNAINRKYEAMPTINDVLAKDVFMSGDAELLKRFEKMSEKFVIHRTQMFKNMFWNVRNMLNRELKPEATSRIRNNFQNYLLIRMWEQMTGKVATQYDSLLYPKLDPNKKTLQAQYFELLSEEPSFRTNPLVQFLADDINKTTGMEALNANSYVKLTPEYARRIQDGYVALANSDNKKVREFAQNMLYYSLAKDNFTFRRDSFVRFIAPQMFREFSDAAKEIRTAFSDDKWPFKTSQAKTVLGFMQVFAHNRSNWRQLKKLSKPFHNKQTFTVWQNNKPLQVFDATPTRDGDMHVTSVSNIGSDARRLGIFPVEVDATDKVTKVYYPSYLFEEITPQDTTTEDFESYDFGIGNEQYLWQKVSVQGQVEGPFDATYRKVRLSDVYRLQDQLPYHHTLASVLQLVNDLKKTATTVTQTLPPIENEDFGEYYEEPAASETYDEEATDISVDDLMFIEPSTLPVKQATVKILPGVDAVKQAEAKGDGINVLRKFGTEHHYGNPFSSLPPSRTSATIKTASVTESVNAYRSWLNGSAHQEVEPARRQWILNQVNSGKLDGQTLLYYKQLNEPSHADALADFVNNRSQVQTQSVVDKINTITDEQAEERKKDCK